MNTKEVDLSKFPPFCGNCKHFSMQETGEFESLAFFCDFDYTDEETSSIYIDADEIDSPFLICENYESQTS